MDIVRLTLQSELTGDELEHIAQKVWRCLGGKPPTLSHFFLAADPSSQCCLGPSLLPREHFLSDTPS